MEFELNSELSMMVAMIVARMAVVVVDEHDDGDDDDRLMDYEQLLDELSYSVAYDEIVVAAHDKVVEVFDEYYLDLPNLIQFHFN